jgi:DNA polymerase-3 subunit delta'
MFDNFAGNAEAVATLRQMISSGRIPQTILLDGPEGIGKATLARRFAAALLGGAAQIEADDLSLTENAQRIAEREKWTSEKRNEEPLYFASQPDFITFAPDGPLRQLTIPQMRFLREQAQFNPLHGSRRVFLIDRIDRANEQAANSLLKTLEEPPPYLILLLTAVNAYDLLPTIRSRSVPIRLSPLTDAEMRSFLAARPGIDQVERRLALAAGRPGVAITIDIAAYDKRRTAMLALLKAAAGTASFGSWVKFSESIGASKSEKLDDYLPVLYLLLEDLLLCANQLPPRANPDLAPELRALADRVSFAWIRQAVAQADEIAQLIRRNIQKSLALDAFVVQLQSAASVSR